MEKRPGSSPASEVVMHKGDFEFSRDSCFDLHIPPQCKLSTPKNPLFRGLYKVISLITENFRYFNST